MHAEDQNNAPLLDMIGIIRYLQPNTLKLLGFKTKPYLNYRESISRVRNEMSSISK